MRVSYRLQRTHCLITLTEKWKESVDNGGAFSALLTDLLKAFYCLHNELLIDAYGFVKSYLKLIHRCLSKRKQRVKINGKYSSWSEILFGDPQRSILRSLLFNIFIFFTFLRTAILPIMQTILHHIVQINVPNLEQSSTIFFEWLDNN